MSRPDRGDILFLSNSTGQFAVGEVVVFRSTGRSVPIAHRIVKIYEDEATGTIKIVTKGDDNRVDDLGLYAPGQKWLEPNDIIGRVIGYLQYVGLLIIFLQDYPICQMILVAALGSLLVLHGQRKTSMVFFLLIFSQTLVGSVS